MVKFVAMQVFFYFTVFRPFIALAVVRRRSVRIFTFLKIQTGGKENGKSIRSGNAYLFVNKELQRVNREALETLGEKGVMFKFPAVIAKTNTVLVLKEPKTKTSTRSVLIPTTVAEMLKQQKAEIEEYKALFVDEFTDYNLVFCNPNGRPIDGQTINRALSKLIQYNTYCLLFSIVSDIQALLIS